MASDIRSGGACLVHLITRRPAIVRRGPPGAAIAAIRGCELGYTETEVAELLGLARETVSRWWSAYAESGEQALPGDRTGRPVGSGRTLNDGQAAWLRTILVGKQPEDVGISSPLWTREAVRA